MGRHVVGKLKSLGKADQPQGRKLDLSKREPCVRPWTGTYRFVGVRPRLNLFSTSTS